jgi:O-antigen/teichoic acid export membrane protein
MRAANRPIAYVTASLLRLLLAITLNIVLLVAGLRIYAVLWSSLAVTAFMAVYMGVFSLWRVPVRTRFSHALLAKFVRYSAPLGLSGLSMFVIHFGDRFFLQRYVSLGDIGIYSLAYKLGMLVSYVQTPFDVYWRSQMFSIVRGPEGEKIYVRVGTYLTLGLTFIVLLFALFARPALRLMVPPSFWPAAQYVPWIATAYVIRTVGAHFRCIFLLEGKTGRELHITSVGALSCVAAYAALIPPFGLWGAVAGTLIGFGAMFVIGLHQAQKVRRFPFEYRRIAIATLAALAVGVTFTLARPNNIWLHAALALIFAGIYPALLFMIRFPHRDEYHAARYLLDLLTARLPSGHLRAREQDS